jgi:hypothetical protein
LKSWRTTPDRPETPLVPRIVSITDTTAVISWQAPPSFNCDISAFHIQKRVGQRGAWDPPSGKSLPPHFRNFIVKDLIPATSYQFRLSAENRMGCSEWSPPTIMVSVFRLFLALYLSSFIAMQQIRTEFGLPLSPESPLVCSMTITSLWIMWFTANPKTFGSASTTYEIQCSGNGKVC